MGGDRRDEIEAAIKRCAALLSAKSDWIEVSCWGGAFWLPRVGIVGNVRLTDPKSHRGPNAELILVAGDELDDLDAALGHLQSVVRTLVTDRRAASRALAGWVDETFDVPAVELDDEMFAPTDEDVRRRQQALAESFRRFEAVAAKMRDVYGLRLPRHVAVWDALWRSASPLESLGFDAIGRQPAGIMTWFEDGGLDRKLKDGLDARLEMRFRRDPPELVTVMRGDSDGGHYGLWYDDPAELPSFVVHNYARDSAETGQEGMTVVGALAAHVEQTIDDDPDDNPRVPLSVYAMAAALEWFADADERAVADDGAPRWIDAKRGMILGGIGPALLTGAGNPRAKRGMFEARYEAFRDEKRTAEVAGWVDEARAELKRGQPAFALVLGRELHWLDSDRYRAVSLELLCAAYEALGRGALAAIARVHHAHRDLPSAAVYERRQP